MSDTDTGQDTGQDKGQDTGQDFDPSDYVEKKEFDKIYGELKTWKRRYQDASARTISDEERTEYDELKQAAEKAEENKAKEAGRFDELKADLIKKHNAEIEKKGAVIQKRDSTISKLMVESKILSAAAAAKAAKPDLIVAVLKERFKVEYGDDGTPFVKAYKDLNRSEEQYDDEMNPATVEWVVNKFLDDNTEFLQTPPKRGTGGHGQEDMNRTERVKPEEFAKVKSLADVEALEKRIEGTA